jgi:hypothetical protein
MISDDLTIASFSIDFGPGRTLGIEEVRAAGAGFGGTIRFGRLFFAHDHIEASMGLTQADSALVLDATFSSVTGDVTRERWPLDLMGHLFAALDGRLGVGGPEEIDRVADEPRANHLDVWWSEGCLLVDEELAALAKAFREGLRERARWIERPLGSGRVALCLPGWFGADGERCDNRLFSPFHLYLPGFDRNENRYDQLTVTGFGRAWQLSDAGHAVERLTTAGRDLQVALEDAPLGFPRAAFAAGWLNYARSNLVDQFPLAAAWTDVDRRFVRTLLASPLTAALDMHSFARVSTLFMRAVYLRSSAGPFVMFWPDDRRRICIGFLLGEEHYEGYVVTQEQVRVARLFINALGLDWGAASVGNNGTLTPEAQGDEAMLQMFPIVLRRE